jgi:alkylated DNA repair dioxygenase AlkB
MDKSKGQTKTSRKPKQEYNKEHHRIEQSVSNRVEYHPVIFKQQADCWFKKLKECVDFEQDSSKWYGKEYDEPRLTALYSDTVGFEYKYSGMTKIAKVAMPKVLVEIQKELEELTGVHYDFVLVNLYVDGKHKVNWHSDSESTMDLGDIASISLGPAERLFRMKTVDDGKIVFSERLKSGSLLRMKGDCQRALQHEVPQEAKIVSERINLTFRRAREVVTPNLINTPVKRIVETKTKEEPRIKRIKSSNNE